MKRGKKLELDGAEGSASKRRRGGRGATPPPADSATDMHLFNEAWRVFRGAGWSSKRPSSRSLDTRYRYVRPGGNPAGTEGIDYVLGEGGVVDEYLKEIYMHHGGPDNTGVADGTAVSDSTVVHGGSDGTAAGVSGVVRGGGDDIAVSGYSGVVRGGGDGIAAGGVEVVRDGGGGTAAGASGVVGGGSDGIATGGAEVVSGGSDGMVLMGWFVAAVMALRTAALKL